MKIRGQISSNRPSVLQRIGKPATNVHQRLGGTSSPSAVTDARQLLSSRNQPTFDARQLLSRQTSKTNNDVLIVRRDVEQDEPRSAMNRIGTMKSDVSLNKMKNPFISTEPVSFKKTISNPSVERPTKTSSALSDQKFVISIANDRYRKRARSPSSSPPPTIQRLDRPSSSRSATNRSSVAEPPKKQANLSTTSKPVVKQFTTSSKLKANLDASTILITNLQTSVTEDDVMELFGEVGDIKEIKTLSRGCVQVIYAKQKDAQAAVEKYHNALLDGQLMYVSLQQSSSSTAKSDSDKYSIDPSFIRQALFNPSASQSSVQFQVKL